MTLRFTTDRRFTAPCTAAGGETFTATFRVLPDEDLREIFENPADIADQKAFLRRVTLSLGDLVDDDGAPMTSTPNLIEQAIGMADMRLGMLRGYNAGIAGARAGN